mmetsp:Transcript_30313/g.55313  ORF Transcript_30313/g.55313 Transcript_30313/m.55313 type:complete len:563 (+) Transcript_30313:29-1717(+)
MHLVRPAQQSAARVPSSAGNARLLYQARASRAGLSTTAVRRAQRNRPVGLAVDGPWLPRPVVEEKPSSFAPPPKPTPGEHIYVKSVLERAFRLADADAAEAVVKEKAWEQSYNKHFVQMAQCLSRSQEAALQMAREGLAAAHELSRFCRHSETVSLDTAHELPSLCAKFGGFTLLDQEIKGTGELESTTQVQFQRRFYEGDALEELLQHWASKGAIEADCIPAVARSSGVDLRGEQVLVMGAVAEVRPMETLLNRGATVIAVDKRGEPFMWGPICQVASESAGTMHAPITPSAVAGIQSCGGTKARVPESLGCSITEELPELLQYLNEAIDCERPLTICVLPAGTGQEMLRNSVGCDVLVENFVKKYEERQSRLPTVAYFSPATAAWALPEAFEADGLAHLPAYAKLLGLESNLVQSEAMIADCLLEAQGPEFAMAAQLMAWRALDLSARGCPISFHCSPAVRGPQFVQRRRELRNTLTGFGTGLFGQLQILNRRTASEVMSAMLVSDMRRSAEEQAVKSVQDLSREAFHSGFWRMRYRPQSLAPLAAKMGRVLHLREDLDM